MEISLHKVADYISEKGNHESVKRLNIVCIYTVLLKKIRTHEMSLSTHSKI